MTEQEAFAFINHTKTYGSVLGLGSIQNLMAELGDVQEKLAIIHVAGTNGKGSVCAFLAQILKEAGYRVGRYSSPAVFCYEEIISINGEPIARAEFAELTGAAAAACERLVQTGQPHPTVFEVETAIAFLYFYRRRCDLVVLETGMGGATDATNLITKPLCSVLTSISMDHMDFLGNSLGAIAGVKSGIIKTGRPVITVPQKPEAMQVIAARARQMNAELIIAAAQPADDAEAQTGFRLTYDADGMRFVYPIFGKKEQFYSGMTGLHQAENAAAALKAAEKLPELGYPVTVSQMKQGLQNASWPGRFETICRKPRIILDGAHNENAARKLKDTIENCFTNMEITYIIGVLADKEHEKLLQILLPNAASVYTVTPDNPRALSGKMLCEEAQRYHPKVSYADTVGQAVAWAVETAGAHGVILAFGSLSYLGQVKAAVKDAGIGSE